MSEVQQFYIPAEDEPSVFSSSVNVREHGSASYNDDQWGWPRWFDRKQQAAYFASWREKNPGKPITHCPPSWFATHDPASMGIGLIVRLREELKSPDYPVFDPAPAMFIGDTRQISLRWVLQYARDNNMSPESAVLVAEHERDLGGLTLDNQTYWHDRWWKDIMELPGIGYPIWRYKVGPETVAVPYLLLPGPVSESIVIVRVHEKNPNITYKLVTIKQKGGEVVGEFTGYEGFDQKQLTALLHTFWAGF
jgi:hypothetical protein